MKWKRIILAIAVALTAVIGFQCFWLFRQYNMQRAQLSQQLVDALAECDYKELLVRGSRIYRGNMSVDYYVSTLQNKYKSLSKSIRIEKEGNYFKKTTIERYKQTDSATTQDKDFELSMDSSKSKPFAKMIKEIRTGLHQVLDTAAVPEVATFYHLLSQQMSPFGLGGKMRVELWKDDRLVSHTQGKDYDSRHAIQTGLLQWKSDNHRMSYRVYSAPLGRVVLGNMAGVIGMSLFVFLLLLGVFWMLWHSIRELQAVNEMKSDFVNNMTHELKTPISVAYAANDALLNFNQSLSEEKRKDYLKISMQQLKKLGQLVEQILQMTMERRKSMKLDMQQVDALPIVNELVEEYKLKTDKDVTFQVEKEDASATVYADSQQLQHVLSNLIDNAVKYSGQQVTVIIRLEPQRITVADNGIGIAREKQEYIFDKFYRVPQGNKQDVKGYGLGLYYVRAIMERMGGSIEVRSALGRGTVFTLQFSKEDNQNEHE
ncbi:MAG: sensor histidine kinase [Prevotella sp.]|jgi:signal transduction histidine kinase